MKREIRVKISKEKQTDASFMVALIPALDLPSDLPVIDSFTNCAVIAAGDENGNGIFSYVHLHADEKQCIGDALAEACAPMSEWVWCELFDNGVAPDVSS